MSIISCKECGAEISKDAKACPKCGKDNRNFKINIFFRIILAIIIFFIFVIPSAKDIVNEDLNNVKQEKFTLLSDKLTTDSIDSTYIEGKIKNNTDKEYSYVQVTFNLYDKDGAQLGTAIDNINNLEPNAIWKYKAIGLITEKAYSYKFVEITGW